MLQAMELRVPRTPLVATTRPVPDPGPGELRLRVHACAVCRTDLHLVDGELPMARLPVVPGHEIVGTVEALGPGAGIGDGARRRDQRGARRAQFHRLQHRFPPHRPIHPARVWTDTARAGPAVPCRTGSAAPARVRSTAPP